MLKAAAFLAVIVQLVGGHESRSLLAPKAGCNAGSLTITLVAAVMSLAIKGWATGNVVLLVGGCVLVSAVGHGVLRCGAWASSRAPFGCRRSSPIEPRRLLS